MTYPKAMVKRWGKSPPRTGQPGRYGKPHPEQCRIGASRGLVTGASPRYRRRDLQPRGPGWQLDRLGNKSGRGMVIQRGKPLGQNPAYRPSAQIFGQGECLGWRNWVEASQTRSLRHCDRAAPPAGRQRCLMVPYNTAQFTIVSEHGGLGRRSDVGFT